MIRAPAHYTRVCRQLIGTAVYDLVYYLAERTVVVRVHQIAEQNALLFGERIIVKIEFYGKVGFVFHFEYDHTTVGYHFFKL